MSKKILPKLADQSDLYFHQSEPGAFAKKLTIILSGPVAQIPSSSNTHRVARRGRQFAVRKSQDTMDRLAEMSALWQRALYQSGEPLPAFGSTLVRIFVVHAFKPRRFDSHNVPKAVCDWLQYIGVIDDDTNAECFCIKAQDYPAGKCDQRYTSIYITERSKDSPYWEQAFFAGELNDVFS